MNNKNIIFIIYIYVMLLFTIFVTKTPMKVLVFYLAQGHTDDKRHTVRCAVQ